MITLFVWWKLLQAQTIEDIKSETGIYFDEIGTVSFYPMKWKVVTYINLEPTRERELWRQTKIHQRKVIDLSENKK
jgi:hypothetical protein